MPTPIPDAIAALLPLVASSLSRYLADDRLPNWVNALIAAVALLGAAIGCWLLAGNFTGNVQLSIAAIMGWVLFLMRGDMRLLLQFFDLVDSPLAKIVQAATTPAPAPATAVPSTPAPLDASQISTVNLPTVKPPQPLRLPTRPPTQGG